MRAPKQKEWIVIAAAAATVGVVALSMGTYSVATGEPIFVDYGAECKKQGPGSHLFISEKKDGTKEMFVLTCGQRSEFRSIEPR